MIQHETSLRALLACFLAFAIATIAGCVPKTSEPAPDNSPRIQSLEKSSYAVGEKFSLKANNLATDGGESLLHFQGTFRTRDGSTRPVDVRVPVLVEPLGDSGNSKSDGTGKSSEPTQRATWLRFGPFTNPFANRGEVGTFEGTITPINKRPAKDGDGFKRLRGEPHNTSIDVEPSLEIVTLQPRKAKCGAPALRGFAGPEYKIKVRAAGFVPDSFEWRISSIVEGGDIRETKTFEHQASGPTDTVGDDGETVEFQPVPKGTKHYIAGIQVRAKDRATGKYVDTSLPFGIHRPVEVREAGPFRVAQHYRPEPVTACIPGAVGNQATYSETETEVRQRTVSVGVSRNFTRSRMKSKSVEWQKGYEVTDTRSQTRTRSKSRTRSETTARTQTDSYNKSESNSFSYSTSKGEQWSVSNTAGVETTASGSVGLPLVAEGEVEVTGKYSRSWGKTTSRSESKEWGSTVTRGESHSFSKSYTLSESATSSYSYSDTKSRSESRTYDFGASATRSQRVTEGITESEKKTWMRSKKSSTLTSYSAYIPPEKFGVFYRQTIRMVRLAEVVSYNACGEASSMGELRLNSWNWAPDLAVGKNCKEELPEPNLPPAQCHIEPCD